ncbi:MAG: TIGR04149 family rSAM-modified RiPP [Parabacteroides sp.]|nr:TIGR04149 family rSAM-modified RiPP [Parabacteroides sp.]
MKNFKKIKLNQMSSDSLRTKQMRILLGGQGDCTGSCACGCDGSSSTSANRDANNTTYTPYSGFNRVDGFFNDCSKPLI